MAGQLTPWRAPAGAPPCDDSTHAERGPPRPCALSARARQHRHHVGAVPGAHRRHAGLRRGDDPVPAVADPPAPAPRASPRWPGPRRAGRRPGRDAALITRLLDYNLAALGGNARLAAVPQLGDGGAPSVSVNYAPGQIFEPVAHRILPPIDQSVRAERFYRKTEIALVLDTSSSMTSPVNAIQIVRDGIIGYVNEAFRNQQTVDDTWVSLIGYSGMEHRLGIQGQARHAGLARGARIAAAGGRAVRLGQHHGPALAQRPRGHTQGRLRRAAAAGHRQRGLLRGLRRGARRAAGVARRRLQAGGGDRAPPPRPAICEPGDLASPTKLDVITQIGLQVPPPAMRRTGRRTRKRARPPSAHSCPC